MTLNPISIYTDEDVPGALAKALKRRGFEASTTSEHGNFSLEDEEQLAFATSIDAVMFTHNVADFPRIHFEFLFVGRMHCGIIVAKQLPIGELLKPLLRLAVELSSVHMKNRLEYLSNW